MLKGFLAQPKRGTTWDWDFFLFIDLTKCLWMISYMMNNEQDTGRYTVDLEQKYTTRGLCFGTMGETATCNTGIPLGAGLCPRFPLWKKLPGKAVANGPSVWASVTHVGDPDDVPAFDLAQPWLL